MPSRRDGRLTQADQGSDRSTDTREYRCQPDHPPDRRPIWYARRLQSDHFPVERPEAQPEKQKLRLGSNSDEAFAETCHLFLVYPALAISSSMRIIAGNRPIAWPSLHPASVPDALPHHRNAPLLGTTTAHTKRTHVFATFLDKRFVRLSTLRVGHVWCPAKGKQQQSEGESVLIEHPTSHRQTAAS